jgi:uncharacterized membrane protein
MARRQRGPFSVLWQIISSRARLFIALLCGLAATPLLSQKISQTTRGVIAWDIGVGVYLMLSAYLFLTSPSDRIATNAARQEEGEWTIFWLTVGTATVSFVAIISEFADMKNLHPGQRGVHILLLAVTLFVSWLMTHTTFAFRYAHEYYADGVAGGLEFPGEKSPDYLDFVYFSLVLGMTFQVSDVQITSRKFRRLAAVHGLLSFLFNTIILALTINLAAGLLS